MGHLPHELLISAVLVSMTVVIHLLGLDVLLLWTGMHLRRFTTPWVRLDRVIVPLGIVLGLFALHGLEIWLYAFAYRLLSAAPDMEEALYLSASAYSTVGAAGAVLPEAWRIVAVLEAVNGMLLIGWSTAFLFQTLHRILTTEEHHPLPEGAIAPEVEEAVDDAVDEAPSDKASPRDSGSGKGAPAGTN